MTSQQRILTALKREQPDRVPVFTFVNPFTKDDARRLNDEPSYKGLFDCVREIGDVIHLYSPRGDTCIIPEEAAVSTKGMSSRSGEELVEITYQTPKGPLTSVRQTRYGGGTLKHLVESKEDLKRLLSFTWTLPGEDFAEFFRNKESLGARGIMQVTLSDPVCAIDYIKPELRALWSIEERDLLRELFELAFTRQKERLEYLLENIASPEIVFYFNGPEYAMPPLLSPGDFDEFVVKYDTRLIAKVHAHGSLAIVHCHGKVSNFLEKFRDMGADGLNPLEPPPMGDCRLPEVKRRIGKEVCLIGNIEYSDLAACSSEEIAQKVKSCIAEAGKGGGFILMPTASPYEVPIPEKTADNFIAMVNACRKYGGYS